MSNPLALVIQVVEPAMKTIIEWKSKTEETKQRGIDATKETRKSELASLDKTITTVGEVANNVVNQTVEVSTRVIDSSNNAINQTADVVTNSINKTSEITKASMISTKEVNNKTIDTFKDMIGFMSEDKKNALDSSKEQYKKFVQIEESRHKSEIEAVYYRTKEETLNEISKNISTYAESVKYINEKIRHLELEIQSKKKKIEPDEKIFEELQQDLRIEESKYEDLNSDFTALIDSIEKLACEYKDSMEEKEYLKNIKREKRELKKHIDKIDKIELNLLNKEKEKLIIDKKLQPKLHEIENLELSLKYLKDERANNEFKGLLNLSNIQKNNHHQGSSEANIIDAEIEDDKKLLGV